MMLATSNSNNRIHVDSACCDGCDGTGIHVPATPSCQLAVPRGTSWSNAAILVKNTRMI